MIGMLLNAQLFIPHSVEPPIVFPTPEKNADVFAVLINPALASFKEKLSIGVYGEKPLLIRDFHAFGVASVLPVKNVNVSVSFNRTGIEYYSESNARLGLSKDLAIARLGIAGNYSSINMKGYGGVSNIGWEVGSMITLTSEVFAIFHVKGISTKTYNNSGSSALNIAGGLVYKVSNEVMLGMNLSKTRGSPGILHMHAKYSPVATVSVLLGYLSNINSIYFGISFRRGKISFALTARYQQVFGLIPTTIIGYDHQ